MGARRSCKYIKIPKYFLIYRRLDAG